TRRRDRQLTIWLARVTEGITGLCPAYACAANQHRQECQSYGVWPWTRNMLTTLPPCTTVPGFGDWLSTNEFTGLAPVNFGTSPPRLTILLAPWAGNNKTSGTSTSGNGLSVARLTGTPGGKCESSRATKGPKASEEPVRRS